LRRTAKSDRYAERDFLYASSASVVGSRLPLAGRRRPGEELSGARGMVNLNTSAVKAAFVPFAS